MGVLQLLKLFVGASETFIGLPLVNRPQLKGKLKVDTVVNLWYNNRDSK